MDSSGWIAIFAEAPNARVFETRIAEADAVIVPTVVLYEVYKITKREHSTAMADGAAAHLRKHRVVDLTHRIALLAADVGLEHRLAMADAIVYATAQVHDATLVTGDADFADLPGAEYIPIEGL